MKNLTILGKSDATITMILDNLESNSLFPEINIINNLNQKIDKKFDNPKFSIKITDVLDDFEKLILGVNTVISKVKIAEKFEIDKKLFINLIHNSSQISSTSIFGYGVCINSLVSIAAHTYIGDFVSVNRNSSIGHHTQINPYVSINPNSAIAGNVYIGEKTQIGMGSIILDGIKIGSNTIIGAGSLVTKNIPSNVVAYGSPCKIIRENSSL